jgi:hypothetical protein
MKVIDNNNVAPDADKLTNRDLALAAYSLTELYNAYVHALETESYKETMTLEEMQETVHSIQSAQIKFNAILQATQAQYKTEEAEEDND